MDVILLDSSPLLDDRPLKKPTTRALLGACEREEVRIVVPSVVVDEVANAAKGSFAKVLKYVRKANHVLREQSPTPALIPEPDVETLAAEFRKMFVGDLEDHGVEIADVTSAPVQGLIDRDLQGRKPFNASGRGFRDALIWNTILPSFPEPTGLAGSSNGGSRVRPD